ncbi:hypothetical protein PC117_g12498 [Phytophthora cactorum]|uniref:Uncharacterized protein n=1 Tax=Phytophthora cactorum TaxID=29920 RepID=A0A8T1D9R0_9STRA|nr:hypothetical protein PC117_g12498 [Phytophthora cactorum]KAG3082103.1 hypothetical protein PC122_g11043 [Phytophthora cactorum]
MDPLQKFTPTPSDGGIICKFRPRCCTVNVFKRVGVLLIFHLLNVLMAIALLLVALVMFMIHVVQQIPQKSLIRRCGPLLPVSRNSEASDECTYRFKLSTATNPSVLLPHVRMTRRVWLAVIYFGSLKVAAGVLSTAVVVLTVVLPTLVLFSGSVFGSQVTFGNTPIAYPGLIISIWLIGAVGVPIVAVLSAKLTSRVCGAECWEIEEAIPVTPEPESSATSFAELGTSTPVAPSAAVAVV